jgi:RNA polymerase sigma-70 factor (ECF subfamily)
VKSSTRVAAAERASGGGGPGFTDHFRAFDEEFEFVCQVLRRSGVSASDAEDLAQEVLVVVWRRWADYDQQRPLRPWLAGIAARVGHDYLKRRWREIPSDHLEGTDPALVGEDHLESSRQGRLIVETLARLPKRHRMLIVLQEVEGLSPQAIAHVLGVPMSTAYTRLRRARLAFTHAFSRVKAGTTGKMAALVRDDRPARRPSKLAGLVALAGAAAVVLVATLAMVGPARRKAPTAVSAPRPPSTAGLLGYWPFDEAPGSPVAHDRSGRGNDCVLHDLEPQAAWTAGSIGGALDLRRGGWAECPQPPLRTGQPPPSMTVMARVLVTEISEAHAAVATREIGAAYDDLFFFGFLGGRLKVSSRVWQGWISRPISDEPGRWRHIAFTRQTGGSTRLYLDGVQVGENRQGERPILEGQTPLLIGGGHTGSDGTALRQHFAGLVDELAVYDRALAPDEIAVSAATSLPLTL